ncbi:MAG: protein kinase [Kofleriaceae bacterium]
METDPRVERLRALVGEATFDERFERVREAGAGGMGRVLEAIDRPSGRRIAVKILTGRALPDRQRFTAEAEILEGLAHPNIVGYVAHGTTDAGEPYLAMDWLDGESLAARLRRGPVTIDEAIALARQLGAALAYAHGRGVVHRDLKPSNVMLVGGSLDDVRLIDFGVAKGEGRDLTHTGQLIGTPGYMAPEQALGRRGIDGRADLFALGCTLYEALTGASPFPGHEVMEVLARLLLHEPPAIAGLVPTVPPRLAALLDALLAKEPEARLADAGVVVAEAEALAQARRAGDLAAQALRPSWAAPAGAVAPAVTVRARPRRSPWPRRVGVAAALAVAAAVAGVALVEVAPRRPAPPQCDFDVRTGCAARCATGDGDACFYLGEAQALGRNGQVVDAAAALASYRRGCALASGRACTRAGTRLLDAADAGDADARAAAAEVLERGCALGSGSTCRRLGLEHLAPKGRLAPDDQIAYRALTSACRGGDYPSCWLLAGLREGGRGSAAERAAADEVIAAACAAGAKHRVCGDGAAAPTP